MLSSVDTVFVHLGFIPKPDYWGNASSLLVGKTIVSDDYQLSYHWDETTGWLTIYELKALPNLARFSLRLRKLTQLLQQVIDRAPQIRAIAGAMVDSDDPKIQNMRIKLAQYWISQGAVWESVEGVDHLVKYLTPTTSDKRAQAAQPSD